MSDARPVFPTKGSGATVVLDALTRTGADDIDDLPSRFCSGAVYPAGQDVYDLAVEAHRRYSTKSGLIPRYWPSVQRLEADVVAMSADLLNGPDAIGNVTSGGTESILLGVKIARDRARHLHPDIVQPEIVLPETAHPAFTKAAQYFGLTIAPVGLVRPSLTLDLDAFRAAITDNTVLIVGSAPNVFIGTVDPIAEMANEAAARDISFHVDSCVGGYFLPFAQRLGHAIPSFDFGVNGVTTMSADLHKFGYVATKGASVILSRDEGIHSYQGFEFGPPNRAAGWFKTPTLSGTRTGGGIAAAWAVMSYLGIEGYLSRARTVMTYMATIKARVDAIPGLSILGEPAMSVFALTSEGYDIFAVADRLEREGWLVKRDVWPVRLIRFMQSPGHAPFVEPFLAALERACRKATHGGAIEVEGDAAYA